MNDTLMLFGVLSLFQFLGGVVAGRGLRQGLRGGWSILVVINLFRGLAFAGVSFFIGIFTFIVMGAPFLILGGLVVLAVSVLLPVLIPDSILETFNFQPLFPILFGGVFMIIGIAIFVALVGESIPFALLFLAAFGGSGAIIFVSSALKAIRG